MCNDKIRSEYQGNMGKIKVLLKLLETELEHAEEYRLLEGPEWEDVAETKQILQLLLPAFGILVANKGITLEEVFRDFNRA